MFRKKGKFVLIAVVAIALVWLVIQNGQNHSRIISQVKAIDSLSVELSKSFENISALKSEITKKSNTLAILKKTVEHSESENDSLVLANNVVNAKLANEIANAAELKKKITFLNNELEAEKSVRDKIEQLAANLQTKIDNADKLNASLQGKIKDAESLEPILKNKTSEIEDMRRSFAPRIGVYASCINTPDCQELYKVIRPYMPKICDRQLQFIYSEDGKNIRAICRKLNCPDIENLYLFIVSVGLDPKTASIKDVQESFRQTLSTGDLQRITTSTFGCDKNLVERAITVCKSVYKY